MAKIFLVIEQYLKDIDETNDWEQKLKENMVEYAIVKRIPFANDFKEAFPLGLPEQCLNGSGYIPIYYCTIEMCRLIKKYAEEYNLNLTGLFYPEESGISCLYWFNWLNDYGIPLVNNGIFTSYYDLIEDWENLFKAMDSDELFIKPDGGDKLFNGKVWYEEQKLEFINFVKENLEKDRRQDIDINEIMVFINKPKKIKAEYRFFILKDKVVCGSQYRRDSILDERQDIMPKALKLAKEVARLPLQRQPDTFYACDIAELDEGKFEVLEINAGSCSGVYQHDKSLLIKAFKKFYKNY